MKQNKGNPRKVWINNISGFGKNENKRGIDKFQNKLGEEIQNLEAAEFMNNYYTEARPKLAQEPNTEWEASKKKSYMQI